MNKRKVAPVLVAQDSNKTSWKNGVSRKTLESGTDNEKILVLVSHNITTALMPRSVSGPPLKEGDPTWTEAYEQALQKSIMFDSLVKLCESLLYRGVCIVITTCGKAMVVPDHADLSNKCEDPKCQRCNTVLYGQVMLQLIGNGRAVFRPENVNLSRFRAQQPHNFYYEGEGK